MYKPIHIYMYKPIKLTAPPYLNSLQILQVYAPSHQLRSLNERCLVLPSHQG